MMPDFVVHLSRLCVYVTVIASAVAVTPVLAVERVPVTSIKPLLIRAIETGESHGTLTGRPAAFMRERFGSTAPIEIDVKALRALRELGCKRLEVTTRQKAVRESANQAPADKELIYQVSYCRDGRFPESK